jgi:hypothetical protein
MVHGASIFEPVTSAESRASKPTYLSILGRTYFFLCWNEKVFFWKPIDFFDRIFLTLSSKVVAGVELEPTSVG